MSENEPANFAVNATVLASQRLQGQRRASRPESVRDKRYTTRMNSDTYWSSKRREDPFDVLRRLRRGD